MPGLVGFTRRGGDAEHDVLLRMRDRLRHQSFYTDDRLYANEDICASRIHKAIVQKEAQPAIVDDVHVWFKGEFFNQRELLSTIRDHPPPSIRSEPADSSSDESPSLETRELRQILDASHADSTTGSRSRLTDPQLLAQLYCNSTDFSFLRKVDGIFSAVVFDARERVVHLITDRYGMGFLYWTVQGGVLLWASEAKAFLAHPAFQPQINEETLQDFFGSGFPLENRTWFQGVELVPPGTVLSWNLREKRLDRRVFWTWNDTGKCAIPADEGDTIREMARLWTNAVEKRCYLPGVRVGATLSGGLDSRAIVAAMPELDHPLKTVTVGNYFCDDVRIARRVAKVKGAEHHTRELTMQNWLRLRTEAVWWSDGQYEIKHMHGCALLEDVRSLFDVNINGFIGDVIMGASYLNRLAKNKEDEYKAINNRARRFIGAQISTIDDVFMHSRCPFIDNELVDFVMSIPDELRVNHHLYKKMLAMAYPEFFRYIPWQETGIPITSHGPLVQAKKLVDRSNVKLYRVLKKIGINVDSINWFNKKDFSNYPHWFRHDPGRTFIMDTLLNQEAIYPEYVDRSVVLESWDRHLRGGNQTQKLSRYLTFEIWLQHIFNDTHRLQNRAASSLARSRRDGSTRRAIA